MSKCKSIYIPPHRSYRKVRANKLQLFSEVLVLLSISVLSVYLFLKHGFNSFVDFFQKILIDADIDATIQVVNIFGFDIKLIELSFMHPQPIVLFILFVFMVITVFILMKQSYIPYNIVMWLNFYLIVFSLFLLYFIFFPQFFPYSFHEYFELFMTSHTGFLFFIFLITLLAMVLVPTTLLRKLIAFCLIIVYYMIFSLFRYALVVLLVSQVSIAFAPIMFFIVYLDFIFFISAYSYFLYKSSVRYHQMEDTWNWS